MSHLSSTARCHGIARWAYALSLNEIVRVHLYYKKHQRYLVAHGVIARPDHQHMFFV